MLVLHSEISLTKGIPVFSADAQDSKGPVEAVIQTYPMIR